MRPRVTSVGLIMPPGREDDFDYPAHIDRDSLDALPRTPGVYLFRNRRGTPIYIGKSVNIRARVLSHLRTVEEAVMLAETRRVDFLRTAGEIGALLLESRLIKEAQPAYNRLLRHAGPIYGLSLPADAACPVVRGTWEADTPPVHGLFSSRAAAQDGLRAMLRRHRLCPALCGLEKPVRGRGCFAHQLGHCLGACVGKETPEAHRARLEEALASLEALVWPFDGPIGIVEELDGWRQTHVIDRWAYVETLEGRRRTVRSLSAGEPDIDVYKILLRPLVSGEVKVVKVSVGGKRRRDS